MILILFSHLSLGPPKSTCKVHFPIQPVIVEGDHQFLGLLIGYGPKAHYNIFHPGNFKGPLQAVDPFIAVDVAQASFTGLSASVLICAVSAICEKEIQGRRIKKRRDVFFMDMGFKEISKCSRFKRAATQTVGNTSGLPLMTTL